MITVLIIGVGSVSILEGGANEANFNTWGGLQNVHTRMHAHTHTHTHIYIYARMHTHTAKCS